MDAEARESKESDGRVANAVLLVLALGPVAFVACELLRWLPSPPFLVAFPIYDFTNCALGVLAVQRALRANTIPKRLAFALLALSSFCLWFLIHAYMGFTLGHG